MVRSGHLASLMFQRRRNSVSQFVVDPIAKADQMESTLARVGWGCRESFGELYDCLAPQIHGVALAVVGDPSIAKDLTREVFVDIWQTAGHYDPESGSVRSWAISLAHRHAVERLRSEPPEPPLRLIARKSPNPSGGGVIGPLAGIDAADAPIHGCGDISSLDVEQRKAFDLAYRDGFTCSEIADLLGVPLGVVCQRLRQSLLHLAAQSRRGHQARRDRSSGANGRRATRTVASP